MPAFPASDGTPSLTAHAQGCGEVGLRIAEGLAVFADLLWGHLVCSSCGEALLKVPRRSAAQCGQLARFAPAGNINCMEPLTMPVNGYSKLHRGLFTGGVVRFNGHWCLPFGGAMPRLVGRP